MADRIKYDYTTEIENLYDNWHDGLTDDDMPIIIDVESREISLPEDFQKIIALKYEVNSSAITFQCSKIIEGHDISECQLPFIKWYHHGTGEVGAYRIDKISSAMKEDENGQTITSDDEVTFGWVIDGEITKEVGLIDFQIGFMDYDTDDTDFEDDGKTLKEGANPVDKIFYKWMTKPCRGKFEIGDSIYVPEIDDGVGVTNALPIIPGQTKDLITALEEVYGYNE